MLHLIKHSCSFVYSQLTNKKNKNNKKLGDTTAAALKDFSPHFNDQLCVLATYLTSNIVVIHLTASSREIKLCSFLSFWKIDAENPAEKH